MTSTPLSDDAPVLIRAQGVGKRFTRFHRRATSLKERVVRREQGSRDDFWALRDVDIEVRRGETVGLMGPNGSGKSTLLKVLSGILRETEGSVEIHGRVASLLELGAGFDGELTGRENVYLNSALLGVPKADTDALFYEIVAFSELGEFIDNPVKHYSSGMYVRLGFSVAVHVDPDILIVDEVLAVGDAAFQKKCLDRIQDFQRQGKTILFVSHSSGLIEALCTRAVVLGHGRVIFDGSTREGTDRLNELMGVDRVNRVDAGYAKIAAVAVVDPSTNETPESFTTGGEAMLMADIDWINTDTLDGNDVVAELQLMAGSGEVVVIVDPQPFHVPAEEIRAGTTSSLRWRLRALPEILGDVTLTLTIRHGDVLIASANLPGFRVRATQSLTTDGEARFLTRDELAAIGRTSVQSVDA
ncbi:ABC transporter ATP-binding protein [Lapillicoccus sp.]|uniref:ABC transporter ATP-binding protein n=1 Tax=Lapillicoccus sp. TaxID=1909287 RepID=UPI0025DD01F5|nr:ABC transporter ATP-binding protein [Lapillicoccus sp.]